MPLSTKGMSTTVPGVQSGPDYEADTGDAQVTYGAPGVGLCHYIQGLVWSYSADPIGGGLSIISDELGQDETSLLEIDIIKGGPGFLPLGGFAFPENVSASFVLWDGGGQIEQRLTIIGHQLIPVREPVTEPLN